MPIPEILNPTVVTAALSSLASTLSMAASIRKLTERKPASAEQAVEDYAREAPPEQKEILADPVSRQTLIAIVSTTISEKLLDQLAKEATQCEDKHVADRDRSGTATGKSQADINAAQCMCGVLRDIKRYNKGALPPGDQFQDWWDSYSCSD